MKKYAVFCKIDGVVFSETIECHNMLIRNGAYLFLSKDWWDDLSSYKNVIKSFPVNSTIVKKAEENK